MSSPLPPTEDAPDTRVTTEPQRRALDIMSQELVNKLNVMVAEQEARAREFAARQHSLSALPQTPPFTTDDAPLPEPPPAAVRRQAPAMPPPLAARKPPFPQPAPAQRPAAPSRGDLPTFPFPRPKQESGKEANVGAFPIIVAIIVGLIILRSCGS